MCASRIQETLRLQKQLQESARKISYLQKQLELANQRWSRAFSVMNNGGDVNNKLCK